VPLVPVVLAAVSVDEPPVVDPFVSADVPEVLAAVSVDVPLAVEPVVSVVVPEVLAAVSVDVPVEVAELLAVESVVVPLADALLPVAEPQTVPGPAVPPDVDSWARAGMLSTSAMAAVERRRFFMIDTLCRLMKPHFWMA
jgi:hypothetical protein